jgi:hypothetical protein
MKRHRCLLYDDYVAIVFCNGERRMDCENVPVFGGRPPAHELDASVVMPRAGGGRGLWSLPHHAVLGLGRFRLAAHTVYVQLWELRDAHPTAVAIPLCHVVREQRGSLNGHAWSFRFSERETTMELVEPDGKRWTGTCCVPPMQFQKPRGRSRRR